jgi:hypothetical protein
VGEVDPWGPAVSERERKKKRSLVGGLADPLACWAIWAGGSLREGKE